MDPYCEGHEEAVETLLEFGITLNVRDGKAVLISLVALERLFS